MKWITIDVDELKQFVKIAVEAGHVFVDRQKSWDYYFVVPTGALFPVAYSCCDSDHNRDMDELKQIFGDEIFICWASLEDTK